MLPRSFPIILCLLHPLEQPSEIFVNSNTSSIPENVSLCPQFLDDHVPYIRAGRSDHDLKRALLGDPF